MDRSDRATEERIDEQERTRYLRQSVPVNLGVAKGFSNIGVKLAEVVA
jgi:hypothetical protein